jgi:hypothetical protein
MLGKMYFKSIQPLLVIFILSNFLLLIFQKLLSKWGFDVEVLMIGNFILFIAIAISFFFYLKSLQNNNPHFFMRMIYSGLLMKMFICIIAVLVYALAVRSAINKMAIFGCFGFYFIYTFTEVKILMRLSKQQKNA